MSWKNNRVLIILILITLLGGFLRFYKITSNPPSLTGDEISFGYSAYSVLKTGHDEYGKFLPLTFQSVGDYKNPVPAYLMVPSIAIFGLSEFAVRFPNAFISTLTIPLFYLFLWKLFKDQKIALVGASFLAISAWHISYSRYAYEPLMASTFVMLGIWFFMKMLSGKVIWALPAAFFLILTMYTAFAPRLFVPLFVLTALVFNFKQLFKEKQKASIFIACCGLLAIPLLYVSVFQGAGTRLTMVLISNDIEFNRYILLDHHYQLLDPFMLLFFWLKRFLNYLQPEFIFINGLNMTQPGTLGLGILYLFEIPFLIFGIADFIKRRIPFKSILVIWLLTGILPDSITNNQQHSGRLLHIFPVLLIFTSLGAISFYYFIKDLKNRYLKSLIALGFSLAAILIFVHAFLVFAVHFPKDKSESFDEGLKQVSLFIDAHKNEYDKIVVDPRHGIDGPYLISNPFLYVLFYTKYDPYPNQI